jgi:hypothetical protein
VSADDSNYGDAPSPQGSPNLETRSRKRPRQPQEDNSGRRTRARRERQPWYGPTSPPLETPSRSVSPEHTRTPRTPVLVGVIDLTTEDDAEAGVEQEPAALAPAPAPPAAAPAHAAPAPAPAPAPAAPALAPAPTALAPLAANPANALPLPLFNADEEVIPDDVF